MAAARDVVRRFGSAVNAHDLEVLRSLFSEDVVVCTPTAVPKGGAREGRDEALELFAAVFDAVPGYGQEHEELVVDGETVLVRGRHRRADGTTMPLRVWLTVRGEEVAGYRSAADATSVMRFNSLL